MNFNVLKCYKLIFNLESFKHNYSNMIMIIIIMIFIFSFFFFYCKDYFNLKKILNIIVYFQLNPNLVKKFLNQKKRENKTHLKKIKNIAVVNNHKIKNKSKIIIFNRVKKANLKSLNKKK